MLVLLTGACGNLGLETLSVLLERGQRVRTFDLGTKQNKKALQRYQGRVEAIWGDVTTKADVERAVLGVDAILHNAAITPPSSELKSELAYRVNVTGTENLLDAAKKQDKKPRFLFTSSIAVFGVTQPHEPPPRRADSPVMGTDHYSKHKIEGEAAVRDSGLPFCIFRIGASPPANPKGGDSNLLAFMFERSLESRVEYVHPKDVAFAEARALEVDEAWGKTLLIGGGPRCQIRNHQLINGLFDAMGMGELPRAAFADRYLYGDWLDTEESQRLLGFQRHSYADFLDETRAKLGVSRLFVSLMSPVIQRFLLRHSGPYKARKARA